MKIIVVVSLLFSFVGFGQTKPEMEQQIKDLLYEYGTFIPQDADNASGPQKSCNISFKEGSIEVLLRHYGDMQAIKSIGGADPSNAIVAHASTINKYTFNVADLKLKNGSLDYHILQHGTGEATLYLNVHGGTLQSFTIGEIHNKNNLNNKINTYRYFNESGARITKLNESFDQALASVPKTDVKLIRIPISDNATNSDWFKNTLNALFIKYFDPGKDIVFEYDSNGRTTSETHMVDGVKNGHSTYYYENGNPKLVEIWKNGKRITFKDQFLEDGTQTLKDGYGVYMTFNNAGNKNFEAQYYAGRRAGKATWYYDNGQISESAVYRFTKDDISGLRWEIVSSFHKDGTPREKGTLKEGNGTWIIYDDAGKLVEVLEFQNGMRIK